MATVINPRSQLRPRFPLWRFPKPTKSCCKSVACVTSCLLNATESRIAVLTKTNVYFWSRSTNAASIFSERSEIIASPRFGQQKRKTRNATSSFRVLWSKSELSADQIVTTVICSRFVVCERMRARLLIPAMFRHMYRTGLSSGMTHSFLAARPSLISIFQRFGFVAGSLASSTKLRARW